MTWEYSARWIAWAAVAAIAWCPLPAAALDVVVESVTVSRSPSGVDGSFDVYIGVGTGEMPPDAAGWQAAVDLAAPGGGVTLEPPAQIPGPVRHPPLISDNFLADFGSDNGPARASATAFLASGATAISDGAGLFRIPFHVDPGVTGQFDVTLDLDPFAGTLLSDASGTAIPFSAVNGTITVAAPTVPALGPPAVGVLSILVLVSGLLATRGRAGRPGPPIRSAPARRLPR